MLVTQSGPGSFFNVKKECFTVIHSTLRAAYGAGNVVPYSADIPSFGSDWGFNLVTVDGVATTQQQRQEEEKEKDDEEENNGTAVDVDDALRRMLEIPAKEIDRRIAKRIKGGSLKFLDGIAWRGLFGLPKSIREACRTETRIMTKENPVFMFA